MIFYLSGDEHKDYFEKMKDSEVLTIEIRANLIKEDVVRFIKRDLRNIEIKCLIIDSLIFDSDHNSFETLKEILEVFYILNPDSRCILYSDEDHRQLVENFEGSLLVLCNRDISIDTVLDFVNGKVINDIVPQEDVRQNAEKDKIIIDTVPAAECPKETKVKTRDKRDKQTTDPNQDTVKKRKIYTEKAIQQDINEMPEGRRNVIEQFPPSDIMYSTKMDPEQLYSVASKPNKISEGMPIKKRIQKAKEEQMVLRSIDNNVVDINRYAAGYKDKVKQHQGNWSCSNIMIGVIGTERKVGATTACLKLALQLSNAGAAVSYSEANSHNHLEVLAREFKLHSFEDHYMFHSIQMYRDAAFDVDAGMNFILLDLGCMIDNDQRISRIIQEVVDHVIVVSGKRGHEQKALLYTLSLLPEKEVSILFNYTREEELMGLINKYKDLALKVSYIPYQPDFDQAGSWEEDFLSIFDNYKSDKKVIERSRVNK